MGCGLFGLLVCGSVASGTLAGPTDSTHFTARDRHELANPPYRAASISPTYQRQIVKYHRQEAPGSILVDTHGPFVYYVLPGGRPSGMAPPSARPDRSGRA